VREPKRRKIERKYLKDGLWHYALHCGHIVRGYGEPFEGDPKMLQCVNCPPTYTKD
jgi:hypothetical protein